MGVLLALLLTALAIEGVPVLHAHEARRPAIYNEECPLAGLAAHRTGAPLPTAVFTDGPLIAAPAPDLPTAAVPSSHPLLSADPRAPPAAR